MRMVEWVEPWPACRPDGIKVAAVMTIRASEGDCINRQREADRLSGRPTDGDDELRLQNFMVIHWASFVPDDNNRGYDVVNPNVHHHDVNSWEDALKLLLASGIDVARVGSNPIERHDCLGIHTYDPGVVIYFESGNGDEIGCWCSGVNVLQVFARARPVHPDMHSKWTLWKRN